MALFPLHRSEGGSFQELAHIRDVDFGQLSILTIDPKCMRGGHYHKRKKEWFCPVLGTGQLITKNKETGEVEVYELNGFKRREFIAVNPYEIHTVVNDDPYADLFVLIIISEEFNSKDPDTFKEED